MAEYLPLDLITEILTKLPVKSLDRFKCVSKTWNSIITSSKFIKQHLHQTLISNPTNIIIISKNSILSSAISTVKLRFDIINHPLNNIPHRPPVDIVESVYGVLLIADSSKKTVCLFNPANKTKRLVPPAPSKKPACVDFDIAEVFGFGYDIVTDDYKVVRLAQWEMFGLGYRETYVYSMRNDSWESVYDETDVSYTLQRVDGVAFEEILCFVVMDSKPVLKCFDLRTSSVSLLDFPELDSYDLGKMTMNFRNLRGCLCLLVNYQMHKVDPAKFTGYPLHNRQFLYADMWELNESKWVKLFRIRNKEIDKQCMYLRLVTYSKDGKSVLLEVDSNWFGWYDLVTKRIKRVPVQGLGAVDSPYVAYPYVESLVSVVNNKEGTRPKKIMKKNDFLSSGFKLKL